MDSWQPTHASDTRTLEQYLSRVEQWEPLPRHRRSDGMQRRLGGIVRAKRERLNRLAMTEAVARWQALTPLIHAHLQADQQALQGESTPSVDASQIQAPPLPEHFANAHQQRNQARQALLAAGTPAQDNALEEPLARLRVHLSLLALGTVNQRDEPLRLAIQVERLNSGIHQTRSPVDELNDVLAELLALGPLPSELWQQEAPEIERLLQRLARPPQP